MERREEEKGGEGKGVTVKVLRKMEAQREGERERGGRGGGVCIIEQVRRKVRHV